MRGVEPRRPVLWRWTASCTALIGLVLVGAASSALAAPGSVDPSFGNQGIAQTELKPSYKSTSFTAISPQPEGSFLATRAETTRRYKANGSLASAFPPEQAETPPVEATEADGKILRACGYRLERLEHDGSPDTSFGNGGSIEAPIYIDEIVPLPSGKILIGGEVNYRTNAYTDEITNQVGLARFEPDGKLDPGFGKDGILELRRADGVVGEGLQALLSGEGEDVVAIVKTPGSIVALTASGALDQSYGSAGVVELNESVVGVHPLPEGKLLVAGTRWGPVPTSLSEPQESQIRLTRYTAHGQPDPSFGEGNGTATAAFGERAFAMSVLWEADGSVLIGGASVTTPVDCAQFEFCGEMPVLARFLPDGHLDPGFGSEGLVRLEALATSGEAITGVDTFAARPGGGVLAGGGAGPVAFIAALGISGELDPTFANAGILTEQETEPSEAQAESIATDAEGRILVAGARNADSCFSCRPRVVYRYLPDGSLDYSFGNGAGFVRVPGERESAISVEPDGGSLVLGGPYPSEITRLTASGEIDASYGEEGTVAVDHDLALKSIIALPGGGAIAAGEYLGDRIAVIRLQADGRLDQYFGNHGVAVLAFGHEGCGVQQLAVEPDGRILLAGFAHAQGPFGHPGQTMMLMRLLPDGRPDHSFGHDGRVRPPVGRASEASAIATQGDKILVAGWTRRPRRSGYLLLRYKRDGHLDRSFANGGISRVSAVGASPGRDKESVELLPTARRIIVVKNGPGRSILAYKRSGQFERSFGSGSEIAPQLRPATAGEFNILTGGGPFGALQGDSLVLAWSADLPIGNTIELERLTGR